MKAKKTAKKQQTTAELRVEIIDRFAQLEERVKRLEQAAISPIPTPRTHAQQQERDPM